MLADAIIYAPGLFALGRATHWRVRAARTSGIFQLLLGVGVAVEALWKTVADGLPDVATMCLFGGIALLADTICFVLLTRFRGGVRQTVSFQGGMNSPSFRGSVPERSG